MRSGLSRAGERGAANAMAVAVILLIAPVARAGQQAARAPQDSDAGSFRISVDVPLVVLHATVTDREGGLVSALDENAFTVLEDGVPQFIRLFRNEDIPVTVGLVIDHSTTMWPKLAEVAAAARAFVRSSNQEDEMFVVNFNEIASLGLSGTAHFTNSAADLEAAIGTTPPEGMTALYDAVAKGLGELQSGSRDKKVLVVVSDGGDNASALRLAQVMKLAQRSNAVVYTVGLFDDKDPDRNPDVLKRLATATGGEAFFPEKLSEVVAICGLIAREIRHQYTIGYTPSNPARDGVYRSIRVLAREAGHGRMSVRARSGYIAGGASRLDEKGAK